ncbi:class III signal peptide-containing protein [Candidatus Micrarchaeota archaeon]|nr:class III signal peptide-containing protein [Candidatus Micrarchaeota archaeon]
MGKTNTSRGQGTFEYSGRPGSTEATDDAPVHRRQPQFPLARPAPRPLKLAKPTRGQGTFEYVLLLGGVLLIVVLAIVVLQGAFIQTESGIKDVDKKKCGIEARQSPACFSGAAFQPTATFKPFGYRDAVQCDCSDYGGFYIEADKATALFFDSGDATGCPADTSCLAFEDAPSQNLELRLPTANTYQFSIAPTSNTELGNGWTSYYWSRIPKGTRIRIVPSRLLDSSTLERTRTTVDSQPAASQLRQTSTQALEKTLDPDTSFTFFKTPAGAFRAIFAYQNPAGFNGPLKARIPLKYALVQKIMPEPARVQASADATEFTVEWTHVSLAAGNAFEVSLDLQLTDAELGSAAAHIEKGIAENRKNGAGFVQPDGTCRVAGESCFPFGLFGACCSGTTCQMSGFGFSCRSAPTPTDVPKTSVKPPTGPLPSASGNTVNKPEKPSNPIPVATLKPATNGPIATSGPAIPTVALPTYKPKTTPSPTVLPTAPPQPTLKPTPVPVCGDKKCTPGENLVNCAKDCPAAACGNLVCEPAENPKNCPLDCGGSCGDGKCTWGEGANCPFDCGNACGNAVCEPGENPDNCATDCKWKACGNGKCEGGENPQICPEDCGTPCGNGICEKGESYTTCAADCGYCGDGTCSVKQANNQNLENAQSCPKDCAFSKMTAAPSCGNKICQRGETAANCPADCAKPTCGNGQCSTQESASGCPADCANTCGDGQCDVHDLNEGCALDCGIVCGNAKCSGAETTKTCPADCPAPATAKPPLATIYPGYSGAYCGNAKCDAQETAKTCATDCPSPCGDGTCGGNENTASCPKDCTPTCGDGYCAYPDNSNTCPKDCSPVCGDKICKGETPQSCPFDCAVITCGDGQCGKNEQAYCPQDCTAGKACGNGKCEGDETPKTCKADCADICGDGTCGKSENYKTCGWDCPTCGDKTCSPYESKTGTCPADCTAACGDALCQKSETAKTCPQDCSA